jgi:hypothetical protein
LLQISGGSSFPFCGGAIGMDLVLHNFTRDATATQTTLTMIFHTDEVAMKYDKRFLKSASFAHQSSSLPMNLCE